LNLLLSHPEQTFYQREIMYETGLSLQAVQRELEKLICLGILKKRETEARVYYQIDVTSSWFRPLMPIPLNPAGCSDPKRPLVPNETGHLFVGAKRRWG